MMSLAEIIFDALFIYIIAATAVSAATGVARGTASRAGAIYKSTSERMDSLFGWLRKPVPASKSAAPAKIGSSKKGVGSGSSGVGSGTSGSGSSGGGSGSSGPYSTVSGYAGEFIQLLSLAVGGLVAGVAAGASFGWLLGPDLYTAAKAKWEGRRPVDPAADDEDEEAEIPEAPKAAVPPAPPVAPPAATPPPRPPLPTPAPTDDEDEEAPEPPAPATPPAAPPEVPPATDSDPDELLDALGPPIAPPAPEKPFLFIVPTRDELKGGIEMPEITTIPGLIQWTRDSAGIAMMEAEDALAVSQNATVSVDFCLDTVARVENEMRALLATMAVLAVLGVDQATIAAYMRAREKLKLYRDFVIRVADACRALADAARLAASGAVGYRDSMAVALETVRQHQVPHMAAAQATGHSGAHGAVYGVADTRDGATPALPAGE
jgi:hypothetical protein